MLPALALCFLEIAAGYWSRRSISGICSVISGILCAGLVPAAIGYGWFVWKLSARTIFLRKLDFHARNVLLAHVREDLDSSAGLRFVPQGPIAAERGVHTPWFGHVGFACDRCCVCDQAIGLRSGRSLWRVRSWRFHSVLGCHALLLMKLHAFGKSMHPGCSGFRPFLHPSRVSVGDFFSGGFVRGYALWRLVRAPQDRGSSVWRPGWGFTRA